MNNMPWFRLYAETVDDEKLRLLAFEDRWHYIAILCCMGQGIIDGSNTEIMHRKVAVKLGLDTRELEQVARRLAEVDLIDRLTLIPHGWTNRQFKSDHDATATERKRRQREREKEEKQALNAVTDMSRVTPNVTVTNVTRTDTDTDTDINKIYCPKTVKTEDVDYDQFKWDLDSLKLPPGYSLKKPPPEGFEEFWSRFPRKVSKANAIKAWRKINPGIELRKKIMDGLNRAIEQDPRFGGDLRYCPYPASWLNAIGWEDELTPKSKPFTDVHLAPTERAPAPQRMRIWV